MNKEKNALLVLVLATGQLAFAEETKPREVKVEGKPARTETERTPGLEEGTYYPYNPPAASSALDYNIQYQQMYGYSGTGGYAGIGGAFNMGWNGPIHNSVGFIATSILYDNSDSKKVESDSITNSALWAYYTSQSSLAFPREELKKQSALFTDSEGRNLADRLVEINAQLRVLFADPKPTDEKAKAELETKQKALIKEGKDIYVQLSERLNKNAEQKEQIKLMVKAALALPEATAQQYGAYGSHAYGIGGNFGGLGYHAPSMTQEQLEAYRQSVDAYHEQVKRQYEQMREEALRQTEEEKAQIEQEALKKYFNRNR